MPEKKEQNLLQKALSEAFSNVLAWIDETWNTETLQYRNFLEVLDASSSLILSP
jgi:hypothetical protein